MDDRVIDTAVYAGSKVSRLPRVLRRPAIIARYLVRGNTRPEYVFEDDGLATVHYSPFLDDPDWQARYDTMVTDWYSATPGLDVRWRMWVLTEFASRADGLGTFAEFGTYRGGCAYMILASTRQSAMHLFDTFSGIPTAHLSDRESRAGLAGQLSDTSVDHVRAKLAKWDSRTFFHAGDVFNTLERTETGPLALAHVDLAAARATVRSLEYLYPRLIPGGAVVFDHYGWDDFEEQRKSIDAFFADKPDRPLALPTGQAVVVRRP